MVLRQLLIDLEWNGSEGMDNDPTLGMDRYGIGIAYLAGHGWCGPNAQQGKDSSLLGRLQQGESFGRVLPVFSVTQASRGFSAPLE